MNVAVLPHHQAVFFQIVYVIEWRLREELEQKPPNVRVEKTFADIVRIFLVIDVFVMAAMFTRPHQHGIFKGSRAEEHDKNSDRPFRAQRKMGKHPMIPESHAEAARREEYRKARDLKPIAA